MTSKDKREDQEPKIDYAELLLSHYTRAEEVIERAKAFNRKNGLPEELMPAYINYTMPARKKKYLNWLKDCTSEQNEKFYDMKTLKAAAFVSDEDTELDNIQYPRRELFQLYRIRTPKGEFLRRTEMWYGLKQDGTEKSLGVGDLDFYIEPKISYEYADPSIKYTAYNPSSTESRRTVGIGEGVKMRVAKLTTDVMFPGNELGTTVYTSPFKEDTVYEMIKVSRGAFDDPYNGCSLALIDESKSRNSYSVSILEDFLAPSFDEIFKRQSQPPASINVKDLVDQLKSTTGQELESKVKPYQ